MAESVFLSSNVKDIIIYCKQFICFISGHGHGGRLGQGHEESLLTPKAIKSLSEFKITDISLGIDHTLFLTSNGQVLACGLNDYHQVTHL